MPGGVSQGPRIEVFGYSRNVFYYHVLGLRRLSPRFGTRAEAQAWLDREVARLPAARRPRERACLCCGATFASEGAHNRLCDDCRGRSEPFPQRTPVRYVARF